MINQILEQLQARERQLFLFATVMIGILAGLAAVLFTLSIQRISFWLFGVSPSAQRYLLVPPAIGIITGVLLARFFPDVRGSGVPQTEAAFHLSHGEIPSRVPIGKFITGVLCVGSGHSMGREGPSVQIGAGLASLIGRKLGLSADRTRALVPIGAAAALAAAFNTPIAAVLFALEEIIGDLNAGVIGPAVIASISSVIVERSILGNHPLFRVPAYHFVRPVELFGYAFLGIVGGLLSLLFCKGLLWARALFARLPSSTLILHPAFGGLLIGVMLIAVPQVMGVGYEYVDQALNGGLVARTMILFCAAKLVATIVSYSSGNAGGIFAPSLYLGAMAGGAVGSLIHQFVPMAGGDPGAYALVGMGALFAGIIRAPMTSVFMVFELTQDYQILVPLMVANLLSFMISRRYQKKPIYHALLEQDLIFLPEPHSEVEKRVNRARDIMTRDFVLLDPTTSVKEAFSRLENNGHDYFVIAGPATRILTGTMLEDAIKAGKQVNTVGSVASAALGHVYPDQPLDITLQMLAEARGPVPVLSRFGRRLEGIITHQSFMDFLARNSGQDSGFRHDGEGSITTAGPEVGH